MSKILPFGARLRTALVSVSCDQTGINRKALTTDKTSPNAGRHDAFEYTAKNIMAAKALVAGAREGGVIWNFVLDAEAAEPAIGEVDLDFPAQRPLGADAENVADDEQPDHQLGINRWPAHLWVVGRQLSANPREVQHRGDRADLMVLRHGVFKIE